MPTLGKDSILTGVDNLSVRSVSWSHNARTIEHQPFGSYDVYVLNVGQSQTVQIEFLEDPGLDLYSKLTLGGYRGGTYIVTDITCNEPLDDVVTYQVTAKFTRG